ncbi:hypothetical protein JHK82_013594 [Glycine max]|nr:hypothetical protein JHK87_013515 [Glycine soja]KAG5058615.1 hypothetical protein JHK86_013611 [Glycine max]KAG5155625.1 hypothetical protein JHK82_013594 [Glycine max]
MRHLYSNFTREAQKPCLKNKHVFRHRQLQIMMMMETLCMSVITCMCRNSSLYCSLIYFSMR